MTGIALGLAMLAGAALGWPAVLGAAGVGAVAFRRRPVLLALLIILAGVSAWRVAGVDVAPAPPGVGDQRGWRMTVASLPVTNGEGYSFDAVVHAQSGADVPVWVQSRSGASVAIGDRIYGQGRLKRREELDGGFATYLTGRGAAAYVNLNWHTVDEPGHGLLHAVDVHRQRALQRLLDAVPGDPGALLAGLVLGDDGRLSETGEDAFRRAGMSHLTAISGANLSFVVACVMATGRWGGGRGRFWGLVAATAAAWGYALLVGFAPPALRAALSTTLIAGGRMSGRSPDLLTVTFLAAGWQLILRPRDLHSISFQLSMAAALGLVLALTRYPLSSGRWLVLDLLLATVTAQIATSALIAVNFDRLSVTAVFANLLAVPIATMTFPLAIAAIVLLSVLPAFGGGVATVAWIGAEGLVAVSRLFGQPWAEIQVPGVRIEVGAAAMVASFVLLTLVGRERRLLTRQLRGVREATAGPV